MNDGFWPVCDVRDAPSFGYFTITRQVSRIWNNAERSRNTFGRLAFMTCSSSCARGGTLPYFWRPMLARLLPRVVWFLTPTRRAKPWRSLYVQLSSRTMETTPSKEEPVKRAPERRLTLVTR